MDKMTVSIASMQGASALYADLAICDNPYPIRTPTYDAWEKGWIAAYQQAVREFAFITVH